MSVNKNTRALVIRILSVLGLVGSLVFGFTVPAFATLSDGSTFDASNGSLTATSPTHDWNSPIETITCPSTTPASGLNCGTDLTKSTSDNAFGQGTKEDNPVPTVVAGSIPPNKSDLMRFYVNKEFVGGKFFIYLAWERSNVLGNANMDFEINQDRTLSSNGVTPIRTPGDLLVTFDFGGSGSPVLGLLTWVTSANGTASDCFASNALPCWGKHEALSSSESEGSVNSATVTDNNAPLVFGTGQLPAGTFGEAGIDLTDAGIFLPTVCQHFGDAYLKSRSSSSFTSEVKDFIAPVNIDISNCGNIVVEKLTNPTGSSQSFGFTLTGPSSLDKTFNLTDQQSNSTQVFAGSGYAVSETPVTGWDLTSAVCDQGQTIGSITVAVDQTVTCVFTNTERGNLIVDKVTDPSSDTTTLFGFTAGGGLSPTSFNLTGGGSTTYSNLVPQSGYTLSETPATGWDLISFTCDNGSLPTNISIGAGQTVTCTATNRARGEISILKLDDAGNFLNGVTFTAYDSGNNNVGSCTTSGSGTCTIGDLIPGTYTVKETAGLPGYDTAADQTATVIPGGTATLTFTDNRQFQVIVLVCQLSNNSLYASQVTFNGNTLTSLASGGGGSLTDLQLCSLGGATFGPQDAGNYAASVNIPK